MRGFLSLSTQEGKIVAEGDQTEIVRGDRVTTRLTFRFKDGSLDEETAVYTQRGVFRLISDHHIQRGPFFPHPLDMMIDVRKGLVVTRTPGKDGKDEVATTHMTFPADLYNGLVTPVVKNLSPDTPETKIAMLVSTPKPRIVTLAISPQVPATFSLAGNAHKSLTYEIKFELGGIAGVVAPIIGKQPPNVFMWILGGEVPAFLREQGPISEDGPLLTITLIGPEWPASSRDQAK